MDYKYKGLIAKQYERKGRSRGWAIEKEGVVLGEIVITNGNVYVYNDTNRIISGVKIIEGASELDVVISVLKVFYEGNR